MAKSDAERAAKYRYTTRVEKTANKLLDLLTDMPEKYQEDATRWPFELNMILFECVSQVLRTPIEFVEDKGTVGVRFMVDANPPSKETLDEMEGEVLGYDDFKKLRLVSSPSSESQGSMKMTRNAFCEQVLGAKLTNSRWGWVGVKEAEDGEPGCLYLFGWEHNRGRDGEGTVGFFRKDVSIDANGRRRPGHRDALEKIERVMSGELKPYVVWQTAVDPKAKRKTIESINGDFVSECDLYVDELGFWTGKIGDEVPPPKKIDSAKEAKR